MATLEAANGSEKRFYNNIRSWKRLVDFLIDTCRDLLREGEIEGWYSNHGHIVDAETASAIAKNLDRLIKGGLAKRREIELMIAFPPIRCGFCEGAGFKGKDKCRTCDGEGEIEQSFFTEENVRKFAEFCRHSGGFDIY
jgi:hypothetical protein